MAYPLHMTLLYTAHSAGLPRTPVDILYYHDTTCSKWSHTAGTNPGVTKPNANRRFAPLLAVQGALRRQFVKGPLWNYDEVYASNA